MLARSLAVGRPKLSAGGSAPNSSRLVASDCGDCRDGGAALGGMVTESAVEAATDGGSAWSKSAAAASKHARRDASSTMPAHCLNPSSPEGFDRLLHKSSTRQSNRSFPGMVLYISCSSGVYRSHRLPYNLSDSGEIPLARLRWTDSQWSTRCAERLTQSSRMTNRTVAVLTTSRADFGHLYWPIRSLEANPEINLRLIAAGAHLSTAISTGRRNTLAKSFGWCFEV